MKLIGKLKEQVDNVDTKEEKKEIIEKAGIELNEDELENVVGGMFKPTKPIK